MEAFDITGDVEPININLNVEKPTNFGTGIELLMNDKNKSSSTMKVDLGDLDKLENDLNDLSSVWLDSSNFDPTLLNYKQNHNLNLIKKFQTH